VAKNSEAVLTLLHTPMKKCTEAFGRCATLTGQRFEPKPQLRDAHVDRTAEKHARRLHCRRARPHDGPGRVCVCYVQGTVLSMTSAMVLAGLILVEVCVGMLGLYLVAVVMNESVQQPGSYGGGVLSAVRLYGGGGSSARLGGASSNSRGICLGAGMRRNMSISQYVRGRLERSLSYASTSCIKC